MKKVLYAVIIILGIAVLLGSLPAPSYAKAQFNMKMDVWLPATHWYVANAKLFIKQIEKRTHGRVKIRLYTGGSLGSGKGTLERVEKGMEEIGNVVPAYTPGRFDLNTIVELPFAYPDIGTAYDVGNELYNVCKPIRDEFKTVRKLVVHHAGMQDICSQGRAIRKAEDFAGMKLRSPGGMVGKTLEILGVKPVSMTSADTYMAMQRKIVDGGIQYAASMHGYKLEEVTDYFTIMSVSISSVYWIINPKTWASLPPDIQQIFKDVSQRASQLAAYNYMAKYDEGIDIMKKAGVEIIELPPEEIAKLRAKTMPVWHEWVEKVEAKGLPGKEVMEVFKKLLAKRGIIVK